MSIKELNRYTSITMTTISGAYQLTKACLIIRMLVLPAIISPISVNGFYAQPEAVSFSIQPPTDVVTCAGCGDVVLTCGISLQRATINLPVPELRWTLNGSMLSSDSDSNGTHFWITLVFSQTTPSQSGVYQCSATDGNSTSYCGEDRLPCITTVTLSNEARVEIINNTVEVENVALTICSSVLLRCGSFSRLGPDVVYQLHWTRNGHQIEGKQILTNGDLVVSSHGNGTHNALYHCLLRTAHGSNLTVASYNITTEQDSVQDEDNDSIEIIASRRAYIESETVSLVCAYNISSTTCPTVSWRFNGNPISGATILTLDRFSTGRSGLYCCAVNTSNATTHETCLEVRVYSNIVSSQIEISTVFPERSNGSLEITSSLPDNHSLIWYHNGVSLEGETRNSLSLQLNDTEGVYGVYQSFVAVLDHSKTMTSLTRVMHPGRSNPPSPPRFREIPRATDLSGFYIAVTWDAPLYNGGSSQLLQYRLHETRLNREFIVNATSHEMIVSSFQNFKYSVLVVDSRGASVSDKSAELQDGVTFPDCEQERVLYPPTINLSCDNGWVDVSLMDNERNTISRSQSRVNYVQGSCATQNGTITIDQKFVEMSSSRLDFLPHNTRCTLRAAATTEDFAAINTQDCTDCFCVDPDNIEYTAPVQCSTVRVSFEQTVHEIAEEEGTLQVCVSMETMETSSSHFTVQITSTNKSAQGGVDFEVLATEFILTGDSTCLDVMVIDDSVVESTEVFTLTLSSADPLISVINGETTISILDNDTATLSLSESSEADESTRSVELCVRVEGTLERNVTIIVNTYSATAQEGNDFVGVHGELTLSAEDCVMVEFLNDFILEKDEYFIVAINSSDPGVLITRGESILRILDDDYVTVSLIGDTNRTINESDGFVQLCVEAEGEIYRNFTISMTSIPRTGMEQRDFTPVQRQLTLSGGGHCENIAIVNDSILETDETFTVTISSSDPGVLVAKGEITLTIQDDDSATLSLSESSEADESTRSVELCVRVEGTLERNVTIIVNTYSATAQEGNDFVGVHGELTLSAEDCVMVEFLNDFILEKDEYFIVAINSSDPGVLITRGESILRILDDDYVTVSLIGDTNRAINESDGFVQLCVEAEGEIDRNFTISMTSIPRTGMEQRDFTPVQRQLTLSGGGHCENIAIVNDSILETDETFTVTISSSDPGVLVAKGEITLTIQDDDYVNMYLTGPSSVMESALFVQLCANMEGVAERAVSIFIDVSPGSAQKGSDYNHPPFAPLIFEAGSNQECFNVSIISDNIAENTTSFSVGISSGVEAVGVRITGGRITVEIIDDDFEISPIAAGVVSGGVMFLLVLALAMAAVRKYRNCRSWSMTYAEKQNKQSNIKTEYKLKPDSEDHSVDFGILPLPYSESEEDQKSVYEMYDPLGIVTDIQSLQESPSARTRNMYISPYDREQLERDVVDFCQVDTSGMGTDSEYIYWKEESVMSQNMLPSGRNGFAQSTDSLLSPSASGIEKNVAQNYELSITTATVAQNSDLSFSSSKVEHLYSNGNPPHAIAPPPRT